ncbi:hypothetical protein GCM10009733_030970 [Nonomuraea maheshkhaliensis]|uniref:histidine kinase n=1 Tax=Nonomuraea maheshkhaliensis TaxID=419590 RepID=A0ABP4R1L7_9ACTN
MRVREWQSDLGLVVASLAVIGSAAQRVADSWGGAYWVFGGAAGAVACALALVRRRDRLWTAVAGLAVAVVAILVARWAGLPAEPGPGLAFGLSVLVGSAVRVLPARQAAGIAAGGLAVVAASSLSGSTHLAVVVLNGGAWLAAVAAGLGPRLLAMRREAAAERVRRHERLLLARELHDVVAHHVTSVVLQAQAARLVTRRDPGRTEDSLAGIETAGSEALAATRRVVGLLREPGWAISEGSGGAGGSRGVGHSGGAGGSGGLGPFERLAELAGRFTGPPVRLLLPDGEPAWPSEVAGTVYRVVQESLTNVSRHAPHATSVTISVTRQEDTLVTEITNDPAVRRDADGGSAWRDGAGGWGWGGGYGLVGMRERAEALGGALEAGPRSGGGWTVVLTLPLPMAAPVRERR